MTASSNERHIAIYAQEPSLLSRQEHVQQAYTSHVSRYQYMNSSVMSNQECPQPHITSTPGQIPYLHQTQQQPTLQQSKDSARNNVVTQHLHQQMLNQSQLNDTLGSILNNWQSLQRETLSMINEMSKRYENEQFAHYIQMFNGKNIDFDEWIAQIEEVANLTGKPEQVLTLAKSSGTPYKMISQTPSNTAWSELKRKLQEVYSLVTIDLHAATDLLRKQHANESLQGYIAYWTEMCHQSMKYNPMTIDN